MYFEFDYSVDPLRRNYETFEVDPSSVPMRERSWADHDVPWHYASYHLSERAKRELLRRTPQMIKGEFEVRL